MESSEITITNVFPMRKRRAIGLGLTARQQKTNAEKPKVQQPSAKTPVSKLTLSSKKKSTKSPNDNNSKETFQTPTRPNFSPGSALGRLRRTPRRIAAWGNTSAYDSGPEIVWDNDSTSPTVALDPGKNRRLISKKAQDQVASIIKKLSNEKNSNTKNAAVPNLFDAWMKKDDTFSDNKNERLVGNGCRKKRSFLNRTKLQEKGTNQRITRKRARITSCNAIRFQEELSNFIRNINEKGPNESDVHGEFTMDNRWNKHFENVKKTNEDNSPRLLENFEDIENIVAHGQKGNSEKLKCSNTDASNATGICLNLSQREKTTTEEDEILLDGLEDDFVVQLEEFEPVLNNPVSKRSRPLRNEMVNLRNTSVHMKEYDVGRKKDLADKRKGFNEIAGKKITSSTRRRCAVDSLNDLRRGSYGNRCKSTIYPEKIECQKGVGSSAEPDSVQLPIGPPTTKTYKELADRRGSIDCRQDMSSNEGFDSCNLDFKTDTKATNSESKFKKISASKNRKGSLTSDLKSAVSSKRSQDVQLSKENEILLMDDDFLDCEFVLDDLQENLEPKLVNKNKDVMVGEPVQNLGQGKDAKDVKIFMAKEAKENKFDENFLDEIECDFDDVDLEILSNGNKIDLEDNYKMKAFANPNLTAKTSVTGNEIPNCDSKDNEHGKLTNFGNIEKKRDNFKKDNNAGTIQGQAKKVDSIESRKKDERICDKAEEQDEFDITLGDNDDFVIDCLAEEFHENLENKPYGIEMKESINQNNINHVSSLAVTDIMGAFDVMLDDWVDDNLDANSTIGQKIEKSSNRELNSSDKKKPGNATEGFQGINGNISRENITKNATPVVKSEFAENDSIEVHQRREVTHKIHGCADKKTCDDKGGLKFRSEPSVSSISGKNASNNGLGINRFKFHRPANAAQAGKEACDVIDKGLSTSLGKQIVDKSAGNRKSEEKVMACNRSDFLSKLLLANPVAPNVSVIANEHNQAGQLLESIADDDFWNDADDDFNGLAPFTSTQKTGIKNTRKNTNKEIATKSQKYTVEDIEKKKAEAKRKLQQKRAREKQLKVGFRSQINNAKC